MSSYPRSGTVSYALYLHRQELQRPKRRLMSVANTKLQLTNELITLVQHQWQTAQAICTFVERSALNRELSYRDILRRNMLRQLEKQQQYSLQHLQQQLGKR